MVILQANCMGNLLKSRFLGRTSNSLGPNLWEWAPNSLFLKNLHTILICPKIWDIYPHNILVLDSIQNIFYSVDSIALINEIMHPQINLTINSYSIALCWNRGSFATSMHICKKKKNTENMRWIGHDFNYECPYSLIIHLYEILSRPT